MKRALALLIVLLLVANVYFSATYGYFTGGALDGGVTGAQCTRFTAPENGDITMISTSWVHNTDINYRTAIYATDGSDRPTGGTLAESSGETTVTASGASDSAISYTQVGGTDYCFAVWGDGLGSSLKFDTPGVGTNQSSATLSGTYPTWPTWTDDFPVDRQYLIQITYTPAGSDTQKTTYGTMTGAGK